MIIHKAIDGGTMTVAPAGRLDTVTAPELEAVLNEGIAGINELIFDLKELEYISSAGLRVLLSAQKTMDKSGRMVVRNVNELVMEVFEVTGFSDILTIE